MLHDRHYMRDPDFRGGKPIWFFLIVINVAVYFFQLLDSQFGWGITKYLALSAAGISQGFVWQFLTFQFLHGDLLHLLLNMVIGIWMFGRVVEERLGRSSFLKLYLLSGFAGGVLQVALGFLFPQLFGGYTVGASAGASGLFAAFCLMEPYAEIRLFLVLPIRAMHLLYAQIAIAVLMVVLAMGGRSGETLRVAHAAHLGGILFAIAYMRSNIFSNMPSFDVLKTFRRRSPRRQYVSTAAPKKTGTWKQQQQQPATQKDLPPEEFISQEVDPILDKISSQGIQSLTDRERQILEAARRKMSRK